MTIGSGAPPCCRSCAEYDRTDGVCRLLAEPTLENRQRLLTMPCNVQRLLELRFRPYGEGAARQALTAWLDPKRDPDDITASYGRAPRDARVWLGAWPYLHLGRDAIRSLHHDGEQGVSGDDDPPAIPNDPGLALRVLRALEKVHRIDPIGYGMLLDFLRGRFEAKGWAVALGWTEATVTDRKYLGIYRYSVYFHEIMESIAPHEAAVALSTRRFSPLDPQDQAALEATRAALEKPDLALAQWQMLYREGATCSLTLLSAPGALGADTMAEVGAELRRVLRVE